MVTFPRRGTSWALFWGRMLKGINISLPIYMAIRGFFFPHFY